MSKSVLPTTQPAETADVVYEEKILILQTNDFHSQMDPLPPRASPPRPSLGGLARLQTYFQTGRPKNAHGKPLVVDCGDTFQGGPFFTFFQGEVDMAALARRNCEAMAVGNHDFDLGVDNLRKQATEHAPDMALLCANLVDPDNKLAFQPFVMLRAGMMSSISVRCAVSYVMQLIRLCIPHDVNAVVNYQGRVLQEEIHLDGELASRLFWDKVPGMLSFLVSAVD